ncbi:hypothetical protein BOX15_Mlig031281g1 [Macrostomum lignano]|uniref:MFS domain-containing protein n=1 Tax=Macrostomum lignano TaxID=282301 RepID=A0A267GLR5_9PLAT|nr:hypothetical protein BOX15_Mlig031281g1 [Macrostomum lignano]
MPNDETPLPTESVDGNASSQQPPVARQLMKDASTQKTSKPRKRSCQSVKNEDSNSAAPNWLRVRAAGLSMLGLAVLVAIRSELGSEPEIRVAITPTKESESVQHFDDPQLHNDTVYRSESRQEVTLNTLSTSQLEAAFLISLAVLSLPAGLFIQALSSVSCSYCWIPTSPHQLLGVAVLISCLLNLLLPATAIAASAAVAGVATSVIRVVQAAADSCVWPAAFAMWGRWSSTSTRARLASSAGFGAVVGAAAGVSLAGLTSGSESVGFADVACGIGLTGCLWSTAWLALSRRWTSEACDDIGDWDSDEEAATEVTSKSGWSRLLVTLKSALTSWPVVGLCLACGSLQWSFQLCALGTVPAKFYRQMFGAVDAGQIWPRMTVPLVAMAIATLLGGQLIDRLSSSCMSATASRRLTVCLGLGCLSACLASLSAAAGWLGIDATVGLMSIGLAGAGLAAAGLAACLLDLAPGEAAVLSGLAAAVGNGMGAASHCVAHHVTRGQAGLTEWRSLLAAASALLATGTATFGLLGSGEVQPWAGGSGAHGEFSRLLEEASDRTEKPQVNIDYSSINGCGEAGEAGCQSET